MKKRLLLLSRQRGLQEKKQKRAEEEKKRRAREDGTNISSGAKDVYHGFVTTMKRFPGYTMETLKELPYAEYAALYSWATYFELYDTYTLHIQIAARSV